jgi:hypothetical protein
MRDRMCRAEGKDGCGRLDRRADRRPCAHERGRRRGGTGTGDYDYKGQNGPLTPALSPSEGERETFFSTLYPRVARREPRPTEDPARRELELDERCPHLAGSLALPARLSAVPSGLDRSGLGRRSVTPRSHLGHTWVTPGQSWSHLVTPKAHLKNVTIQAGAQLETRTVVGRAQERLCRRPSVRADLGLRQRRAQECPPYREGGVDAPRGLVALPGHPPCFRRFDCGKSR